MLGNGDGTLRGGATATTGLDPASLAAGDINADGKLDLVTANRGSNNVSVLGGVGDGTFQTADNYAAGSAPNSVALADFNADGKSDIVTANNGSNDISVLLGAGDGSFRPPLQSAAGSGPGAVAVGQFNPDSSADVSVTNQSAGTVSVLLNAGNWPHLNAPSISISDVTKLERHRGQTLFVFNVSLSAAYDQTITLNYATADGTAMTADHDYQSLSGTLTFAPGQTTKTITIVVFGDKKKEPNESFFVNLSSSSSNALIGDGIGLGTILDDDNL